MYILKIYFLNIIIEWKIKTLFNLYHACIKHKPQESYAEIEHVIESYTCFIISFFKYESRIEEAFSWPHKYPTSMGIHSRLAWNSLLKINFFSLKKISLQI